MTTARVYRVVPLVGIGHTEGEMTVSATGAVTALELAKAALGEGTAFDLCDGARVVLANRAARRWGRAGTNDDPV